MKEVISWKSVFSIVDEMCSGIDEDDLKHQAQLMLTIKKRNLLKVDRKKFNQWVTEGILTPSSQPDTSGYPIYNHIEIKKALLAAYLYNTYQLRPSEIRIATQIYATGLHQDIPALNVRDLDQGERARLILTGRILGVCGALVLKRSIPPQNTIIICHTIPERINKIPANAWQRNPTEVPELINPKINMIGWSGEESHDEVFPLMKEKKQVDQRLGNRDYYSIPIPFDNERTYSITLGINQKSRLASWLDDEDQWKSTFALPGSRENKQLAQLLDFGLFNIQNLQESLWEKLPHSRLEVDATLFTILVTSILLRKPTKFIAAAFYGFDGDETLHRRAYSPTYPEDSYPPTYVLTKKMSPFSWVFSHRTHLIVNRPYQNDFRLSNEISTPTHSHAIIPAIQGNQCSGVLHVIGRRNEISDELSFTYEDIGVLFFAARVMGEAYQRNVIASVDDISRVFPIPDLSEFGDTSLKEVVTNILVKKEFFADKSTILSGSSERYLTLFAIKLQTLQSIDMQWAYMELIQQRLYTFFNESFFSIQGLDFFEQIIQIDETQLVVVVDNLTEIEVKQIRSSIQDQLNDISSINPSIRTRCAVWSVHIPYDNLMTNYNLAIDIAENETDNLKSAVADIVSRTMAALKVIWQVRDADVALKQHNYRDAESILSDALILDNNNSYIWRHLAQARFGLGKYQDAYDAAEKAKQIDAEKNIHFASNYQRLAEALFGLKKYKDAFDAMREACKHSRDFRYRSVFIQLLILHNTPSSLERALAMIIDTSAQIEPTDTRNVSWLEFLRGEARLRMGDTNQALEAFEKTASISPVHHDPEWDILRNKFGNDSV